MRILWCDDELDLLDIGCKALTRYGHTVHTFTDCLLIMDLVKEIDPEVIIMDHNMFDKDGITAIKQLKASEFDYIPVLLCTASANPEKLTAEAKADAFIAKPFNLANLRNVVASFEKHS